MKSRFEGWYYKHQRDGNTLAVIPGKSAQGAFIQVVTQNGSYQIDYPLEAYHKGKTLRVGSSVFTNRGIRLDINEPALILRGTLDYGPLAPLRGDIMGPFRFFPMECRHEVVSMAHSLTGAVELGGQTLDFNGGKGYIEGDSGVSFPTDYFWFHTNDFSEDCSVMASVARIPFCGLRFWGCICVVWINGREYRLATYKGVRIRRFGPGALTLEQGVYRLEITVEEHGGHALAAPVTGVMSRTILENPACPAHVRFTRQGKVIFEGKSQNASYEYAVEK